MKTSLLLLLSTLMVTAQTQAQESTSSLPNKAQAAQQTEIQHNQKREAEFIKQRQGVDKERKQLQAELDELQKQVDQLSQQFAANEQQLAEMQQQLTIESSSLGELFGIVRQNGKELQTELEQSITAVDQQSYNHDVNQIVAAKTLPSLKQLENLWRAYEQQIFASGEAREVTIPYVTPAGEKIATTAIRLGSFAVVGDNGPLDWQSEQQVAMDYTHLPDQHPTRALLLPLLFGDVVTTTIDPSRGKLTKLLANKPTLLARIQQGGVVGYVILGLLTVGLTISFIRLLTLFSVKRKIKQQLTSAAILPNNPLGRVLSVNQGEIKLHSEALELRLLEVIIDEQGKLESGLSMLKLLAALAPMLGLLGTVSGMIETFQVITQYGNSDPTIMAGGISTALITTVLGLVAAMPLLLSHNILSSQVETIRLTLEKQGIGLVAERAEQEISNEKIKQVTA